MSPLSDVINDPVEQKKGEELLESGDWPEIPIKVSYINERFLVFNHVHGSLLYGYGRFFGIPVGIRKPKSHVFTRPLELSLFETVYLEKLGHVFVFISTSNEKISHDSLITIGKEIYPNFEEKFTIYEDLRDKNYIPRPGQKFGADFIVYEKGPGRDHSSFCIQVLSQFTKISSIDVVRSARLATSVKKRFVLANPTTKTYFSFKWHKP